MREPPAPPPPPPPQPGLASAAGGIPPEAYRWNWGAFAFTWIWGLGNRVYISLLAVIPFVGIVMAFILGANGSQWAWHRKPWRDVEHFRRVQHGWAVAAAWVWGGVLVLGAVAAVLVASSETSESGVGAGPTETGLTETVTSDDQRMSITIPEAWTETDRLEADAEIQAEHVLKDAYVMVVTDPKEDFVEDIDLREFVELNASDIGEVTVGPAAVQVEGRTGYQAEVDAVVDGVRIIYLITAFDAGEEFVRVIAWTVPSEVEVFRPILKRITSSLRIRG